MERAVSRCAARGEGVSPVGGGRCVTRAWRFRWHNPQGAERETLGNALSCADKKYGRLNSWGVNINATSMINNE